MKITPVFYRHHVVLPIVICLLGAIFFLFGLGRMQLWDFDETYFATIGREMQIKNEWIVPIYNGGELYAPVTKEILGDATVPGRLGCSYADKPIMIFWGICLSATLFGMSEFTVRLPSVIWSIGTLLLVYSLAWRLLNRRCALIAPFILATMLTFVLEARALTCDASFLFGITGTIWCYVGKKGVFIPIGGKMSIGRASAFYLFLSIAVLSKGPAGFIFPVATIICFECYSFWSIFRESISKGTLLFIKRITAFRPIWGLLILGIFAGGWYLQVGVSTEGKWWEFFFWDHNVNRAQNVMEGHHGTILFYPAALLIGTFPWSVFLMPVLLDFYRTACPKSFEKKSSPFSKSLRNTNALALTTLGFYIVFFSLVQTKLPHYLFPSFPLVAIFISPFIDRWLRHRQRASRLWTPAVFAVFVLIGATISGVMLILISIRMPTISIIPPLVIGGTIVLPALLALGLFFTVSSSSLSNRWNLFGRKFIIGMLLVIAIAFPITVFVYGGGVVSDRATSPIATKSIGYQARPEVEYISFNRIEPSWVLYSGCSLPLFRESNLNELRSFLDRVETICSTQNGDHFPIRIISTQNDYDRCLKTFLGEVDNNWVIDKTIPYFLKKENLVILRKNY